MRAGKWCSWQVNELFTVAVAVFLRARHGVCQEVLNVGCAHCPYWTGKSWNEHMSFLPMYPYIVSCKGALWTAKIASSRSPTTNHLTHSPTLRWTIRYLSSSIHPYSPIHRFATRRGSDEFVPLRSSRSHLWEQSGHRIQVNRTLGTYTKCSTLSIKSFRQCNPRATSAETASIQLQLQPKKVGTVFHRLFGVLWHRKAVHFKLGSIVKLVEIFQQVHCGYRSKGTLCTLQLATNDTHLSTWNLQTHSLVEFFFQALRRCSLENHSRKAKSPVRQYRRERSCLLSVGLIR